MKMDNLDKAKFVKMARKVSDSEVGYSQDDLHGMDYKDGAVKFYQKIQKVAGNKFGSLKVPDADCTPKSFLKWVEELEIYEDYV